jgi:predicted dehydrogenase
VTGPVRIGLVGAGRLAEVGYLPAAAAARDVVLAAVAEPDPVRRDRVAALAGGLPAFPSAAALLVGADVDALVLATPAAAHLDDARLGASHGLPVLVEKPPAPDRAGADAIAALTPAPHIAFNRRFDPAIAALRAATPAGTVVAVVAEISYRRGGWGAHAVADDALLDLGPHLVDLARWITGADVTRVRRASVTPQRAAFDLELGTARARIRCATDRMHHERVEVRHRDGTLVGRHRVGGPVGAVLGRLRPGPHPLVASLIAELEALARTVRGEPDPVLGLAADGVAVMAVLDEVRTFSHLPEV